MVVNGILFGVMTPTATVLAIEDLDLRDEDGAFKVNQPPWRSVPD